MSTCPIGSDDVHPEGIVLTTSSTLRQVRTQLWFEVHRLVDHAKVPFPQLKTTELKFRDDNNFALGFSTDQAETFRASTASRS